jgi:hypothetical protein
MRRRPLAIHNAFQYLYYVLVVVNAPLIPDLEFMPTSTSTTHMHPQFHIRCTCLLPDLNVTAAAISNLILAVRPPRPGVCSLTLFKEPAPKRELLYPSRRLNNRPPPFHCFRYPPSSFSLRVLLDLVHHPLQVFERSRSLSSFIIVGETGYHNELLLRSTAATLKNLVLALAHQPRF